MAQLCDAAAPCRCASRGEHGRKEDAATVKTAGGDSASNRSDNVGVRGAAPPEMLRGTPSLLPALVKTSSWIDLPHGTGDALVDIHRVRLPRDSQDDSQSAPRGRF